MGTLYTYCSEIQRHIDANGLDLFKTRGALAMECGFLISMIDESDPDDPGKIESLRAAAKKILDLDLR